MTKPTALFSEFAPASYEEWLAAASDSLPDKDLARLIRRSYEDLPIHPLPHRQDLAGISHMDAPPGQFPYVRGTQADGYRSRVWRFAQDIGQSDLHRFNQALVQALANGQTAIYLDGRPSLNRLADLEIAFADIDLAQYPLLIQAANAGKLYQCLGAYLKGDALRQLHGCLGADPLRTLLRSGSIGADAFERMAAWVQLATRQSPRLDAIAIATDVYHDAGASAVQEAALAMATAVTYIREMLQRGLDVDAVAGKMWFFMRVGENFFMEIAKFRAVRMMWAQIVDAFGGGTAAQKIKLHAGTSHRNKTRHDAYVNMLRVTTEAMAAALGGADSLQIAPFDDPLGESSEFSRRIARSLHFILQEEVKLADLIDPAGGAWHIEKLTDQLAKSAWNMFQQIEGRGGLLDALQAGSVQTQIAAVADQRHQDLAEGRATLIGSSKYPNLDESLPEVHDWPAQSGAVSDSGERIQVEPLQARRLAIPYEELRHNAEMYRRQNGRRPRIFLASLDQAAGENCADSLRELYAPGGFDIIDRGSYDTVESALEAVIGSHADAVVVCASGCQADAFASEYVRALKAQLPALPVILADDVIGATVNAYEINRALQEKSGIGE